VERKPDLKGITYFFAIIHYTHILFNMMPTSFFKKKMIKCFLFVPGFLKLVFHFIFLHPVVSLETVNQWK